jgi:hypothetical protein
MNWGYKIIVVYVMFVAGMIFLAYKASTQNKDLVTEDYYAKELVYQQKIDQAKRASALAEPVEINIVNHELVISFPKEFAAKKIEGDVAFYCPSDEKKDINQQFALTDGKFTIKLPESTKGLNYVKINWAVDGVTYYLEKKIII